VVSELDDFYELIDVLRRRSGGERLLRDCDGRMGWPPRGVYFFFEDGETLPDGRPRVTRVGTHALSAGTKSTLWSRLAQHRGVVGGARPGGGSHRGSVFRLHVGQALLARDGDPGGVASTWSIGSSAPSDVLSIEHPHERRVSAYIGSMPFLVLGVDDEPSESSDRGVIERGAISTLGAAGVSEKSSPEWLGRHSRYEAIRRSGLWNVNHVDEVAVPFIEIFQRWVEVM